MKRQIEGRDEEGPGSAKPTRQRQEWHISQQPTRHTHQVALSQHSPITLRTTQAPTTSRQNQLEYDQSVKSNRPRTMVKSCADCQHSAAEYDRLFIAFTRLRQPLSHQPPTNTSDSQIHHKSSSRNLYANLKSAFRRFILFR